MSTWVCCVKYESPGNINLWLVRKEDKKNQREWTDLMIPGSICSLEKSHHVAAQSTANIADVLGRVMEKSYLEKIEMTFKMCLYRYIPDLE